jgi:hypothetical protein
MKLGNLKITNKGLYWGLIITFFLIYICVGFVSTLHAITFFQMANTMGLAVLLALAFEVGQSSVLFSILMTKNKEKFLPWFLMVLLTGLQITGNVFSSFKHIMTSGSLDWQYFQKSILFGVQASNPEMYQVIISWLQGALLPVVALGLTALVAQNINILIPHEEEEKKLKEIIPEIDETPEDSPETPMVEKVVFKSPGIPRVEKGGETINFTPVESTIASALGIDAEEEMKNYRVADLADKELMNNEQDDEFVDSYLVSLQEESPQEINVLPEEPKIEEKKTDVRGKRPPLSMREIIQQVADRGGAGDLTKLLAGNIQPEKEEQELNEVVELKKEKESLLKEDVKVPQENTKSLKKLTINDEKQKNTSQLQKIYAQIAKEHLDDDIEGVEIIDGEAIPKSNVKKK